jgi:chemotaxis protein MotB
MPADLHKAPTIIVVKKRSHHDEHHGGAWKVAYADFVTAMMALFIVLWLLSASEKVQKAVGGYFLDPKGTGRQTGSTNAGVGETLTLNRDTMRELKEKLEMAMRQSPSFERIKNQVKMTVTAEGLRIDLLETDKGLFFETGNPSPTAAGTDLLGILTSELAKLPNKVAIEGHTDAAPYGRSDYSNWELSADRANSARRIMQNMGLGADQVSQVRGFADQRLLAKDDPRNPKNRRISIIVRSQTIDTSEEASARAQAAAILNAPTVGADTGAKPPAAPSKTEPAAR